MRAYPANTFHLAVRSQFDTVHDLGIRTDNGASQHAHRVVDEYVFAQPDAFRDRGAGWLQADNKPASELDGLVARQGGVARTLTSSWGM
jgi:hypothetical protein